MPIFGLDHLSASLSLFPFPPSEQSFYVWPTLFWTDDFAAGWLPLTRRKVCAEKSSSHQKLIYVTVCWWPHTYTLNKSDETSLWGWSSKRQFSAASKRGRDENQSKETGGIVSRKVGHFWIETPLWQIVKWEYETGLAWDILWWDISISCGLWDIFETPSWDKLWT